MKTKASNWFLCKVRYDKTMEDGGKKRVTEQYVVEAMSFTEAEVNIMEEMISRNVGDLDVVEIDRCSFKEMISDSGEKWYKAKVYFILLDEKSDKEKKTPVYYLVDGNSLESARKNIDAAMSGSIADYEIASVSETKIIDVFDETKIIDVFENKIK